MPSHGTCSGPGPAEPFSLRLALSLRFQAAVGLPKAEAKGQALHAQPSCATFPLASLAQ